MGFHKYDDNDVPSRTHTLWKSLGYRVYATTVTTLIALLIFKPSVVFGTVSLFFLMDILGGLMTYYTFERFWYWMGLQ
jgi:ABC-type phosphate transport system permease subunit